MSHFRSSTLTVDQTSLMSFVFSGQQSWRASAGYLGPGVAVGNVISNNDYLYFGDGSSIQIWMKVLTINSTDDYFVAQIVDSAGNPIEHAYASVGSYEAYFESNARITTNDSFGNQSYRAEVVANPGILNEAPVSSVPPIVQVADNSIFTYQIAAFDSDGQTLTYRIGNASEFISSTSSASILVAPAGVTVSATGLLTWDVRDVGGAAVADGQKYTMTAMVSDGLTKTPIDFILQIVSTTTNQAPSFTIVPPTQNLNIGQSVSVALVATDPNANLTTITALNPPVGMITDYHASHQELHVDFTATTGGSYVVTFQATDAGGLTAQTSVTFNVAAAPANAAPVAVDDDLSGAGSGAIRVAVIGTGTSDVAGAVGQLNDDSYFDFTATGYTVASFASKAEWDLVLSGYDVVVVGSSGNNADGAEGAAVYASLVDFAAAGGGIVSTGWYQYHMERVGSVTSAYMDAISPVAFGAYQYVNEPYVVTITGAAHPVTDGLTQIGSGANFWETPSAFDATSIALATSGGRTAAAYDVVASGAHLLYLGGIYLAEPIYYDTGPLRSGAADRLLEQGVAWAVGSTTFSEDEVAQIDGATLLENDTDPDGDTLVISAVSATSALGGAVVLNGDGTIGYDPRTALNRLAEGETVQDSFTYTVDDGHGGTDTATVRFNVRGVNDAATISGTSTGDVVEDGTQSASGTLTVTDPDTGEAELQPIAAGTAGANGYGTFSVLANGQWTYTLNNAAAQSLAAGATVTDTITATSEDGTDTQLISVTVTGVNDVATIGGTSTGSVEEDGNQTASGTLTVTDVDTGEAELQPIAAGTPGANGYGTFAVLANGQWTYTLDQTDPAVQGLSATQSLTDTIMVTSQDGTDTQLITVTIAGSNDAPVANDDRATLDEDTTLVVAAPGVLGNDTDDGPPGPGQLVNPALLVSGPSHAAAFTFNSDGSFSYTPAADYTGTDSFTYKLNDGQYDSNTATVTLTIDPLNDAPAGVNESYNVIEDTNLSIGAPGVLNNDDDVDGDALTAQLVTGPAHAASFGFNADGSFSYTPAADYVGPDSFSYRPFDGNVQGNLVTVSLDVLAEDDAAIARDDAFAVLESGTLAASVFADNGGGADSDPDSPLVVESVNGSAASVGQTIMLASGATVRLNADGTFAYDPSGRFNTLTSVPTGASNTSAPDSFTYGLAGGGTANVVIQVNGQRSIDDLLIGSAGNDVITDLGVNYNDSFLLQQGGNDSASGLGGNDGFYFGAAMTALDSVDGGSGTDSVALQGNYAALVIGTMTNVENLVLLAGDNISFGDLAGNFYDYNVTTNDGNVGPGGTLTVIGGNLRAGEDLVFNGAAETDGMFRIFAGQGNDTLIGGARNDGFFFGVDANLTGADVVNGGGGIDTIALRGNYVGADAVAMLNGGMTSVETLAFLSGHTNEFGGPIVVAGFDYDFTTADGNVAAGQRLEVAAGNLRADESLRFDGRAELDGSFRIVSGAGDDNLFGGAGNDLLYGATGADRLEGGAGADTYLYRFATDSLADSRDLIIWGAGDKIDLSLIDADANTAPNEAFAFIGSGAFTGTAGELRVTTTGANGIVEGDVNGDGVADLVIFVQNYVPVAGDFLL